MATQTWEEQMGFFYISDEAAVGSEQDGEAAVVLAAGGEVDYAASPQLRERIAEHLDAGRTRLLLDLSKATFIDSTAIGVLMGAVLKLRELGEGSLMLVCAEENRRVLRIFEIAGVDGVIDVYSSREEALSTPSTAG
jgi:anti-sigma B factor antagonist